MKARKRREPPKSDEAPDVWKSIKNLVYKRYGMSGLIIIFVLTVASGVWWQWDKVKSLPGVKQLVAFLEREGIPQADVSRFSIMVANLDGDGENSLKQTIIESLSDLNGVQVLSLDRMIEAQGLDPEQVVLKGHTRAKEYLAESGADVLLWGIVLRHENKVVPKLYWTTPERVDLTKDSERYPLAPNDLSLPVVFWDSLSDLIQSLVLQQMVATMSQGKKPKSDEAPDVWKSIKTWVYQRYGMLGIVVLLLLTILSGAWWQWDKVKNLPGIKQLITYLKREEIPHADVSKFSILIANLGGDEDNKLKHVIVESLREFKGIEVRPLDIEIETQGTYPEETIQKGEALAKKYLAESGANVLLWGTALQHEGKVVPKLHWTISERVVLLKESGRYPIVSTDLSLPEIFWDDLIDVIRLLVIQEIKVPLSQGGRFTADRLLASIIRVEKVMPKVISSNPRRETLGSFLFMLANALATYGDQAGNNQRLNEAIEYYRRACKEITRERMPLQWALTLHNLGTVLLIFGERESGTRRLEEAVVVFHEALKELTRERVPLQWASTENGLGNALSTLGERENSTARLGEAMTAYREALEELPQDRVPLQRAMILNNLGIVLWQLGKRESGTSQLEEAVATYYEALKGRTRERVPLDWATTKTNLGNALLTLGERESGTARFEEAVKAYREALQESTRERVPLDWAFTQSSLGTALTILGEREGGTAHLEEAVTAFYEALKERTRERVPLDWAMTQQELGIALTRLGELQGGTTLLERAVTAYREALKERTHERVPLDWAFTQSSLGIALTILGEREGGTGRLKEAVTAHREALKELTHERVPLDWARIQHELGTTLSTLGERETGTTRLEEALTAYREALKERTRERVPLGWARTNHGIGLLLIILSERKNNADLLCQAARCFLGAASVFRLTNLPNVSSAITQAQRALAKLEQGFGKSRKTECLTSIDEEIRALLKWF